MITHPLVVTLYILLIHFVGDFVLQSHNMATKKSYNLGWLLAHVGVYTLTLMATAPLFSTAFWWAWWVGINGLWHFIVDSQTSKLTAWLWRKGDVHNFFVAVGADQFIHYVCLLGTWWLVQ